MLWQAIPLSRLLAIVHPPIPLHTIYILRELGTPNVFMLYAPLLRYCDHFRSSPNPSLEVPP